MFERISFHPSSGTSGWSAWQLIGVRAEGHWSGRVHAVVVIGNYKQLVDTTVELARKVGGAEIVQRIAEDLKDNNEA